MGFFTVLNFVVSPGHMRVSQVVTEEGAEVSTYTFVAIGKDILMLCVFLICSEHLVEMVAAFLAYKAVMQKGGLASS